jgi:hypothetical protein
MLQHYHVQWTDKLFTFFLRLANSNAEPTPVLILLNLLVATAFLVKQFLSGVEIPSPQR